MLLESDAIVLGSPVYFNNVSAQMKAFMDRTWCMRGRLKNKIGGALVVGKRYRIKCGYGNKCILFEARDNPGEQRGLWICIRGRRDFDG